MSVQTEIRSAAVPCLPHQFHTRSLSASEFAIGRPNTMRGTETTNATSDLFLRDQQYLTHRGQGLPAGQELETAWNQFFDLYSSKIRKYAFTCGAAEKDISDCVQEVWTELLVRLPTFRLDPNCGQFDTWRFDIVRG